LTPEDPRTAGGTVVGYNASGLTQDVATVNLNAGNWSLVGSNVYRYRDPTGIITRIDLRPNVLSIKGGKSGWAYTRHEPAQGRVAGRLVLAGSTWCAAAPAKTPGANDHVDKFVGQPNSGPPASCPAVP